MKKQLKIPSGCMHNPHALYIVCVKGKIWSDKGMYYSCDKCTEEVEDCFSAEYADILEARIKKQEILGPPRLTEEQLAEKKATAERLMKNVVREFLSQTGTYKIEIEFDKDENNFTIVL